MVKQADNLELVEQARAGSRDAMDKLAVCIHQRLYPYLCRLTSDHDLAEDLLQEILLAAVRFLDRLERLESFWPWIYGIARSKIQQHFRDRNRRDRLQAAALANAHYRERTRNNRNALESVIRAERRELICSALGRLKRQYRDVLERYCFEEMSLSEIASATGRSYRQVSIQFFRAKRSLRRCLYHAEPVQE
ncbi:MAG: RNA polymerase sigma factor [Planctomycetota bacterium]